MIHLKQVKNFFLCFTLIVTVCFLMSGKAIAQTTMVTIEGIATDEEGSFYMEQLLQYEMWKLVTRKAQPLKPMDGTASQGFNQENMKSK